jgi:hypothetical protein
MDHIWMIDFNHMNHNNQFEQFHIGAKFMMCII